MSSANYIWILLSVICLSVTIMFLIIIHSYSKMLLKIFNILVLKLVFAKPVQLVYIFIARAVLLISLPFILTSPCVNLKFRSLEWNFSLLTSSLLLILKNKSLRTFSWNATLKARMFLSINYLLIKLPYAFFPNCPGHWIFLGYSFCLTSLHDRH